MLATIDTYAIGQRVAIRYAKTPDTIKTYYGDVHTIKGDVITLAMRKGGYRSFKFDKIVTTQAV